MKKIKEKPTELIWQQFEKKQNLTKKQLNLFQNYYELLKEWNEYINLTAIRNLSGIIHQHFDDSLILQKFINLKDIKSIADIGTGAGFPSIPLKIIYPHLKLFLIEVNKKKQKFLAEVIDKFELDDVEIIDLDWRTFLRKTEFDIDLFVTRAAIDEVELIRMFKPACFYKNSKLIYWAAINWQSYPKAEQFIKEYKNYKIEKKERKLVFMQLSS